MFVSSYSVTIIFCVLNFLCHIFIVGDPSTWGAWNNWGGWGWPGNSVQPAASIVVPPTYGYNTASGQALIEGSVPSTFDYNHGSSDTLPPAPGGFWPGPGAPAAVVPPHHVGNDSSSGHPFAKHARGGTWKRGASRPPRDRFLRSDRKSAEVEDVDTTQTIGMLKLLEKLF